MFKRHQILKKFLLIGFTLCLLFVFSGLGVLSVPKPAEAQWLVIKNLGDLLEQIILAIWKFAIYPLLKKVIISLIVTGDWGMTSEELAKWAVQDLAFQAVNAVFLSVTGFSLCANISDSLKLSISKWVAPHYKIECKFDNSTIIKLAKAIAGDPTGIKKLRKDLFGAIININTTSNNGIGLAIDAMAVATENGQTLKVPLDEEISTGGGLLATRDCKVDKKFIESQGQKEEVVDKNKDKIVDEAFQPKFCRKTGLEGWASDAIKSSSANGEEWGQTVKSEVLTDLLSLAGMAISTVIEHHALNPLQQYLAESLLDSENSSFTESQQGPQRTGSNRLITFPSAPLTSAPVDLGETTTESK